MRQIDTWDCPDKITRASTDSIGPIVAKTANYTIPEWGSVGAFTNKGASAAVTFTLPPPKPGRRFIFFKTVTNQDLIIQATATSRINNGSNGKKYKNVTNEAGVCELFSGGFSWFVRREKGSWVNDNA